MHGEMSGEPRAFNAEYDASPELYDSLRDCWLNERRFLFLAKALERAGLPQDAAILELGSGTGWLLTRLAARFPRWRFTGLEPLPGYVEFARREHRAAGVEYTVGTAETAAEALGARKRYDAILSNDVLHHVVSESGTAESVARVAKENALWLAIEPNWKNPYVAFGSTAKPGERNFWPRRFMRASRSAGWTVEGTAHLFLIPPFIRRPPRLLIAIERIFERFPLTAGGVCLKLRLRAEPDRS
jgi:SAM-dependent methyltransferase